MKWTWSFRAAWFGYVPAQYIPLSRASRLYHQLLWIVLLAIACMYPWLDPKLLAFGLYMHVWLLLPRMWMMLRLRKFRQIGMLKINDQDTSCYKQ
ncbi:hypothetical protein [Paenibacillus sp. YYML68]|uniref:hypothetical protein n=1 Tax=Paenibacillus sp. YYML68 TaxID=2909250 RepID=UPI002491A06E|nr:hypothetical protein [Paenibacillus sp. YYML68]